MAFLIENWQASSPNKYGMNTQWIYTTTDAIATVEASNYFLSLAVAGIQVNDLIYIVSADETNFFTFVDVTSTSVNIARKAFIGAAGTDGQIYQTVLGGPNWVTMAGDVTIAAGGVTTIGTGVIDLAMLSAGITPSHVAKFAGTHNFAGGGTTTSVVLTGALATDIALVSLRSLGSSVGYVFLVGTVSSDQLLFTFAADPGATDIDYVVFRAAV